MSRKNSLLHVVTLVGLLLGLLVAVPAAQSAPEAPEAITFTGTELLTRPEATSISVTVVPDAVITLRYQYGTTSGGPYTTTGNTLAAANVPTTVVLNGLSANTRYYYRMQYSQDSGATWTTRDEYSFWTARAPGSPFTFTITSDSHVDIVMGQAATWTNVSNDVLNRGAADFHLDLGDTVAIRGLNPGDVAGAEQAYENQLPYFNRFSQSRAVFLVPGNHEQREGWHLQGTLANSLPVIGVNAQKKYFPMPVPDGFYTGDSTTQTGITGDGKRENYYAWTWGDALFVVIDPFWYTTTKPYVSDLGGGEDDATGSGDAWDWTLGQTQFNWLKSTLQNSNAAYKFVFTHQILTDASLSQQEDYGHAGANHAHMVEWGGNNETPNDTVWGWTTRRAAWGADPVHQVMVEAGVSAVFHGHDHQYAYEKRDGVVYQSVPTSGWGDGQSGFNMYTTGDGYTIRALPNTGHLRVTVSPAQTTVDYYRMGVTTPTANGTYTIEPTAPTGLLGDVDGTMTATSTDALIILSADVGINSSAYCPMNCGDVNADGFVNSADALIILSYNVGLTVPFPVGTGACPISVTQPPGCN